MNKEHKTALKAMVFAWWGSTDTNIIHLMEACQNAIEDIVNHQVELEEHQLNLQYQLK